MSNMQVRNWVPAALLALTVVLLALPALAQALANPPEWWSWHHHGDFGWAHMTFGTLMMIVFWGGLILLIVLAVRWLGGGSSGVDRPPGARTALQILEERFARGEIDRDEFEARKRALSG